MSATCLSISGLVAEHVHAICAISCDGADVQWLQVGPGESEVRQALILPDVIEAFDSFQNTYPEVQISLDEFRQALPWNVLAPAEQRCIGQIRSRRMPGCCQECLPGCSENSGRSENNDRRETIYDWSENL